MSSQSPSGRRLEERVLLRFLRLAAALAKVTFSLPQGSPVRRRLISHTLKRAIEAANRGDDEAIFLFPGPEYETITPAELAGLGFEPVYKNREGRLRFQRQWVSELEVFEQELLKVIDLGDRILLLGRMRGVGAGSGAEFEAEVAYLLKVSDGRVVQEQPFRSHEQALEAAGLSE